MTTSDVWPKALSPKKLELIPPPVYHLNAYTLSPFYIFDDPTYFEVDGVLKLEVVISDYIGRFCLS